MMEERPSCEAPVTKRLILKRTTISFLCGSFLNQCPSVSSKCELSLARSSSI